MRNILAFKPASESTSTAARNTTFSSNMASFGKVGYNIASNPRFRSIRSECLLYCGHYIVSQDESEPRVGRIIVFQWSEGKLLTIVEKEIKGAPYCLTGFNGKLLSSVNSLVRIFDWTPQRDLHVELSYLNDTKALYLKYKGDFILIGGPVLPMTLKTYKQFEGAIEEIRENQARVSEPVQMTAIEILNDKTFLGAENNFDLFVCQKDRLVVK